MKHRRLILVIFSLGLLCLAGFLIARGASIVNSAYPAPPIFVESEGEPVAVNGTEDVTFTVDDAFVLNKGEVQKMMPESYQSKVDSFGDFASIVVNISITSDSDSEQNIQSLRESMLSIGKTYSNGIDLPSTVEISEESTYTTIGPHESRSVSFVYTILRRSLPQEIWNSLTNQDIYFVHSLHPAINKIKLDVGSNLIYDETL